MVYANPMAPLVVALLSLAVAVSGSCVGQSQQPTPRPMLPSLDQVQAVWASRVEKVRSARFELNVEHTLYKGFFSSMAEEDLPSAKLSEPIEANPPTDQLLKGTETVSIKAGKLRYEYDRPQWNPVTRTLYPYHYIDTFDGVRFKHLLNPASGQHDYPLGGIKPSAASQSAMQFPISAIFFSVRGVHPQYYNDLDNFTIASQPAKINSRPCIELVRGKQDGRRREVFYLDAERDYVVVRKVTFVNNRPEWQLDVRYITHPVVGWIPQDWEYIIRTGKGGQPRESGRYKIAKVDINSDIPDTVFDLVFPPSTRVLDRSSGQEVQYIIRDDQAQGRVIPTSQNPTYQDLEKSPPRFNRVALLLIWSSLLVVALVGYWLVRRRRIRSTSAPVTEPRA